MSLFDSLGKYLKSGGKIITNVTHGVASDGDVYPLKVDTGGRLVGSTDLGAAANRASALFNAGGSATLVAASAGTSRIVADFIIGMRTTPTPSIVFVGGAKKLTPRLSAPASTSFQLSPTMQVQTSANVAIKVSAIGAGSSSVQIHYR